MSGPDEDAASEITRLLLAHGAGDFDAASRLLPLVHQELRRVAAHQFADQPDNHTWQPTALVHEAFLKLFVRSELRATSRAHFFAVAAKAMRQLLVDHATLLRLTGRTEEALYRVEEALRLDGENVEGRELLERLRPE